MSFYSLRKLRHVYRTHNQWYRKSGAQFSDEVRERLELLLEKLSSQLRLGDRKGGTSSAKELDTFAKSHQKKSPVIWAIELAGAMLVALFIAVLIRQTWFELYEIPSGSMRPTFREKDRLIVTKTTFGLNIPLNSGHFYFNPDNVQRGGVVIWSGENTPLFAKDRFLGILPYTRRYIKRLVGKPGDTLYFYGGEIWGVDKNGESIDELRNTPWMQQLEHVPFSRFEGTPDYQVIGPDQFIVYKYFNQEVARLRLSQNGSVSGEIFDGKEWKPESKTLQFGDHFGIDNFAKVRLIPANSAKQSGTSLNEPSEAYLQIFHHPSLTYPQPTIFRTTRNTLYGQLHPLITTLPLQPHHLDALRNSLYTARFVVQSERASRYSADSKPSPTDNALTMRGVPNGTYEFYDGIGYEVSRQGTLTELSSDHPLQPHSLEQLIQLFNAGIEIDRYANQTSNPNTMPPMRFAYWRNGTLFAGGGPLGKIETDRSLQEFVAKEKDRAESSSSRRPYRPFIDRGSPLQADGSIDGELILEKGLKIPEKHYLVLGDNHAMSADSRVIGFLPEDNLEGTPSIILWPMQKRWGPPAQAPYPWITSSRLVVWILALGALTLWSYWVRRETAKPFQRL